MRCDRCGAERGAPDKLPRGWKRFRDRVWCPGCRKEGWVLRAITIPVASPVDAGWPEFRRALRECWSHSTALANWAVLELVKADVVRTPGMEKMPPKPAVRLYPVGINDETGRYPEKGWWKGMTRSASCVLNQALSRYMALRWAIVWERSAAPPSFRYPTPFPVPHQAWSIRQDPGGALLLDVVLAGRRWTLRLRGGPDFRRQTAILRQLASGEAEPGELAIYRKRSSTGSHRSVAVEREPGGGRKTPHQEVVKIVAYVPKKEDDGARSGTLFVRTGPGALLTYRVGDAAPAAIRHQNSDHLPRWVAEFRRRLGRLNEDRKREKRLGRRYRMRMNEAGRTWSDKHRDRIKSHGQEVAAMLAKFAARRRVERVEYDDTDKSYLDGFPWAEMREWVGHALRKFVPYPVEIEFTPDARKERGRGQASDED